MRQFSDRLLLIQKQKSQYCLFLNIKQIDALNFINSLFQASTCFEYTCLSSGGQQLYYTVSGIITLKQVNGLKLLRCTVSKILKFKAVFVTIWGVHRWNSKWGPVQWVICHYFTCIILQKKTLFKPTKLESHKTFL